jgi:hypothetical protein
MGTDEGANRRNDEMTDEQERMAREIRIATELARDLRTALLLAAGVWVFFVAIAAAILALLANMRSAP